MPFIINTLIDKKMVLGREEFVRPHAYGGQWQRLRIGILCSLNGNASFAGPSGLSVLAKNFTFFSVGLCQGVNGGYTNPAGTPDAVIASNFGINGVAQAITFSSSAGTPGYWTATTNPGRYIWKSGTVETVTAIGSSSFNGSCTPYRMNLFYDFTLNGNNTVTIRPYGPASSAMATTDISSYQFQKNLEVDSPSNAQNVGSWGGPATVTYNGNYNLDCVSISWQRSQPTWDIYELCVLRFY